MQEIANNTEANGAGSLSLVPPPAASPLEELNQAKKQLADAEARIEALTERLEEYEGNNFAYMLANMDAGDTLRDCDNKVRALTEAVATQQKAGSLTLKVVLKPFRGETIVALAAVDFAPPKEPPQQCIFFRKKDGALSRKDPNQRELF